MSSSRKTQNLHNAHNRARFSRVCLCGLPKRDLFSFCIGCFHRLPAALRASMRSDQTHERDDAFLESCKLLGHDTQVNQVLHPVNFSESQLDQLFLSAGIDGKRIAIAALMDWARIERPRAIPEPSNGFAELLSEAGDDEVDYDAKDSPAAPAAASGLLITPINDGAGDPYSTRG